MAPQVDPLPQGRCGVIPYMAVAGCASAIDFYTKVFGATETFRMEQPDGRIGHAELSVGGGVMFLCDELHGRAALGRRYARDAASTPSCSAPSTKARPFCVRWKISFTVTAAASCAIRLGMFGGLPRTSRTCRPRTCENAPGKCSAADSIRRQSLPRGRLSVVERVALDDPLHRIPERRDQIRANPAARIGQRVFVLDVGLERPHDHAVRAPDLGRERLDD